MKVIFESERNYRQIDRKIKSLIRSAIAICIDKTGFELDYELNVLFTGNDKIKAINYEQRNIDKITDVLSFPMVVMNNGKIIEDTGDYDVDTGKIILGDIVVSVDKAVEQAQEYGHGFEREVVFLVIHGLLHLLGYDHETVKEEKIMKDLNYIVLNELGLKRYDQ